MPRPFESFKSAKIGTGTGLHARPDIAILALSVIANYALLEAALRDLFLAMLGANPAPAAEIYASLTGTATQKAALRAVAGHVMSPDELDVLNAVLHLVDRASTERNTVAHSLWLHSPQIPNGVLLQDPKALVRQHVAITEWFANPGVTGKVDPHTIPKMIQVYDVDDFDRMSERIFRVHHFLVGLRFIVSRDPTIQDGIVWQTLSREPEILEYISQLQRRRGTTPSAPPQSRPPDPPEGA